MTREEWKAWAMSLKTGDRVIVKYWNSLQIATVEKVTPTGRIKTDLGVFYQDNCTDSYTGYGKTYGDLAPATPDLIAEAEKQEKEDAAIMPRVTDLAGNEWLPVKLDAFRKTEAKIKELCERAEKAEARLKEAVELLRGTCSACKHYSAYHRKGKCANCWRDPANLACFREYQEDCWEWKYD